MRCSGGLTPNIVADLHMTFFYKNEIGIGIFHKDIQLFNKEVDQFQEIRFQDSPRSNLLSISPSSDLFSKVEFVDFPRPVDEINCTENKFSNKIQDKEEESKESHIKQHNNDQTLTTNINQNNEDDEDLDIIDVVGSTLVYGKEYKKRIEHRNGCVEFGRLVELETALGFVFSDRKNPIDTETTGL
uniref:Uncharacterized protein n=1 Tax=Acrobeloides nanus TaxID=290746 RepID=A0A914EJ85_9BILA